MYQLSTVAHTLAHQSVVTYPVKPQSFLATSLSSHSSAQAGLSFTAFRLHIRPLTRPFSTQDWNAGISDRNTTEGWSRYQRTTCKTAQAFQTVDQERLEVMCMIRHQLLTGVHQVLHGDLRVDLESIPGHSILGAVLHAVRHVVLAARCNAYREKCGSLTSNIVVTVWISKGRRKEFDTPLARR